MRTFGENSKTKFLLKRPSTHGSCLEGFGGRVSARCGCGMWFGGNWNDSFAKNRKYFAVSDVAALVCDFDRSAPWWMEIAGDLCMTVTNDAVTHCQLLVQAGIPGSWWELELPSVSVADERIVCDGRLQEMFVKRFTLGSSFTNKRHEDRLSWQCSA